MTDKELWEKSQQWDNSDDGRGKLKILESVEKFAELVRADERDRAIRENAYVLAEREANAKVCDAVAQEMEIYGEGPTGYISYVEDCAAAIRARGNT